MPVVDKKIEQWKSRLLDLSRRNKLLFFKETKRGSLQIIEPPASSIFEMLVRDERKLSFAYPLSSSFSLDLDEHSKFVAQKPPSIQKPLRSGELRTNMTDQQIEPTLYNLRSKARTALEEQGVHVLYFAFGLLEWFESSASTEPVLSPLLLVPVELSRASVTKPYALSLVDEDIFLNPTLSYRFQTDFNLSLPSLPEDWEQCSLEDYLENVRDCIKTQSRWSVSSAVYLALFSFEKLVMLRDLDAHADRVKGHPLINALAGDPSKLDSTPPDLPSAHELDDKVKPQDVFQILDADSSQQEAIERAKRGVSLVIQGPPGTGKSQTIANLIAELLILNKKVLFVAEKKAAVAVVYKRLAEYGLDAFCLDAHGHKAGKAEIIAQLRRAFEEASVPGYAPGERLQYLAEIRSQLNQYVRLLHTRTSALNQKPFQVLGAVAALEDAPDLRFKIQNILSTNTTQLQKYLDAIAHLVTVAPIWEQLDQHPWRDTLVRQFSFQLKSDVAHHLTAVLDAVNRLATTCIQVSEIFGLPKPSSLAESERLLAVVEVAIKSPASPASWFVQDETAMLRKRASDAQSIFERYKTNASKLFSLHNPEILALDNLPQLVSRFQTSYKSFLRILSSDYRRDLQSIAATSKHPRKLRYGEARAILELAQQVNTTKRWIDEHHSEHKQRFGRFYRGADTQWNEILSALDWTESCKAQFANGSVPKAFIETVSGNPQRLIAAKPLIAYLKSQQQQVREGLAFLGSIIPVNTIRIADRSFEHAPFSEVRRHFKFRLDHLAELEGWVDWANAKAALDELGLSDYVSSALAAKLPPEQMHNAFLKRFYYLWLDAVYDQFPILRTPGAQLEKLVENFKVNDEGQLAIARRRVVTQLTAARQSSLNLDIPKKEIALLKHELAKKKRYKPIRRLFSEMPNLLLTLAPCLMMSPLSASQFLSGGDFEFDTIIYDEASQILPEDAISSIMRGKQIIVAGDSQQLPPTPFFKKVGIDGDGANEEEVEESLESILQEFSALLPSAPLNWHYRSRHEALIAFSNYHFYDNRLITFPNAHLTGEEFGVEFVYVPNGLYDRGKSGKNRIEARRVAELVFDHYAFFPKRSLGVVAFSQAQSEAIDEEIERMLRVKPDFEELLDRKALNGFFVKNLENVQGDERDVMFFSVGYGRDSSGNFILNFGPLNSENGPRRLNVAISRARFHVKLISSILPQDIDLSKTNSRGVKLLRYYLEYVQAGGNEKSLRAEVSVDPFAEFESPFEESVYNALTERGLTLQKQVGCSGFRIDLAVVDPKKPGRYLLGIECDGATYHSANTARDRDRLRQQVLEGLGWRILRIWSRDWVVNRPGQVLRVLDAVAKAA